MKRVAIYYRVSAEDQKPDLQIDGLRTYAAQREFKVVGEFVDTISGLTKKRPELDAMLEQVRKRKVDVVLVWKFDRFARSTSHLVNTLEEFSELGVDFISYTQAIDTSTAAGKLTYTVLAAIAEFERNLISERVKAGMAAAKARGEHVGRKRIPMATVGKIKRLKRQGKSLRQIATATGVAPQTVANYSK